jgi:hypothetical protein
VVEVAEDEAQATKTITVANKGDRAGVYRVSYRAASCACRCTATPSPPRR